MTESRGRTLRVSTLSSYGVVLTLFILSMITYIDRTSISTAKEPIAAELGLSDSAMGMVFSAFALGYAVMQLPAGWLADRFGPRATLAGAVGLWSILTALTGAAWSYHSLLAIRFLFGAGEAAVFPGSARAIRNWLRPEQRGRANGALFAGSRLGAAFSYPLLVWMLAAWNWRSAFFLLGLVGVIWAAGWVTWFRDFPQRGETRRLEETLSDAATGAPAVAIARPLGLAMLQYFASNFTNFICLSWMLPYLKSQYHLSNSQAAVYSMAPLLLGATAQGIAGSMVDRIYASRLRPWSRRLPAMIGFSLAAAGLVGVTRAHSAGLAVIAFSVAIFGADMTISPSWVFCADIAGSRTGRVSGAMNMCGSFGALVSANAFPYLQQKTGTASAYFSVAAFLNVAGIFCWLWMHSVSRNGPLAPRPLAEAS
jgi:ACS family glucarate transporter-like MFS transporter